MKRVVITGASSGLGAALAHSFYEQGYNVLLIGRNEDRLKTIATTCEGDWVCADVTKSEALVNEVIERFGKFDVWVNNAGMAEFDFVTDQSTDVMEETMRVNAVAPMLLSRDAANVIERGGVIVNICSQAGKVPTPKSAVYAGSKAALLQFSNALRLELKPRGIHVMTVNPGPIATPFFDRADKSGTYADSVQGIMLDPKRLADAIVKGVRKRKREINAPWWMNVGANVYAICPNMFEMLAKRGFEKK
ncbi:SDR family NAD(P)-dependent oxidoreductase [Exiguobacterium aestuarii]|uniref:SDR family NAD(P)-dependent oxidoreductase n=1 Tax=Exiguobacterium aestuarii TaxID=273527 RepID=A0ABW2PPX1_9BACL|nr:MULTISPECIES: SDR family oxidoreductase [Exiguobacterium]MCT4786896.1 SDR family oxidoreductase [Exiguobacterium aestuarii]